MTKATENKVLPDRRKNTLGYELLDSGAGRRLERFGNIVLARPCSQAVWPRAGDDTLWSGCHAEFRRKPAYEWQISRSIPNSWTICVDNIRLQLACTGFGHLGFFPEQRIFWHWIRDAVRAPKPESEVRVLNLFAYTGGSTMAAMMGGASVCHVDASRGTVQRARDNAALNVDGTPPVRWIVDDVHKFLKRELKRGNTYEAIILDPPTFGRGARGEVFKAGDSMIQLLDQCRRLLSRNARFVLLTSHTTEFSPTVLRNVMAPVSGVNGGSLCCGEMVIPGGDGVLPLPSGAYCLWRAERCYEFNDSAAVSGMADE